MFPVAAILQQCIPPLSLQPQFERTIFIKKNEILFQFLSDLSMEINFARNKVNKFFVLSVGLHPIQKFFTRALF